MPTKKLRGTEGRNGRVISVSEGMHLSKTQRVGEPHDSKDYVFKNIKRNNTKQSGKTPGGWSAGYDVKTRSHFPGKKK